MTLSNRRAQRGFSRVDLGMLLIVTFLGVLMSLTVDRWVYGGKHLKALGEWSDVKLAEYQVETTRELEDFAVKRTSVWTLP